MSRVQQERSDHENAKAIEDILTYIVLCERGDLSVPDMQFFDGALLGRKDFMENVFGQMDAMVGRGNRRYDLIANGFPRVGGAFVSGKSEQEGGVFDVVGARTLSVQEKQKVLRFKRPMALINGVLQPHPGVVTTLETKIVETREVSIDRDGVARTVARGHMFRCGESWFPFESGAGYQSFAFAIAVTNTYLAQTNWKVSIRVAPQTPSVGFFTDAEGVKDFFRFREIPEGKARRDALLHWVGSHWRKTRKDPEVEAFVREHLRGKRDFHWHGMSVEIGVPPVDETRMEQGATQRRAMRDAKADRRRRALQRL
jgi:hypothetical protein